MQKVKVDRAKLKKALKEGEAEWRKNVAEFQRLRQAKAKRERRLALYPQLVEALRAAQIPLDRLCDWLAHDRYATHASGCACSPDGTGDCTCFVSSAPDGRDAVEAALAAAGRAEKGE